MRIANQSSFTSSLLRVLPNHLFPGSYPAQYSLLRIPVLSLLLLFLPGSRLGIAQASEQDIATTFRAGQTALRQGDAKRAVEDFKKVLALDPGLVEAEVNLGLAYQSLLDYGAAARYLSHALGERPDLAGVNVIVGMDYLKLGQPEKAAPFLEHALKLDPSSRDAHDAMALYYLTQENFQGVVEQYRQLAKLTPDKADALFKIGHQYVELGARLAYRGARLYRDSSWGHRFLGDILLERNRWEDAAGEYNKALTIDPRQTGLHAGLGDAYLHLGKLPEAEAEFQRELQIDSRSEQAWLGLANVQLAKGQVSEAVSAVSKVWEGSPEYLKAHPELPAMELSKDAAQVAISQLVSQPESPAKHLLLAALYGLTNDDLSEREAQAFRSDLAKLQASRAAQSSPGTEACRLHHYSQCIAFLQRTKPLTSSGYLQLGKAYFTTQQYDRAADVLVQVHGDQKASAEASYWLERTYQALAAASYAQLESSYPDSWRTHQLRAEGYALRQDHDAAVKEYEAALQAAPKEAELHESLGEFYLDNRSDDEARKELETAFALDPSRTKTLYLLGRLYVLGDKNEDAVQFLQRALQLQPNLNEANGLLGTAYVRMGKFAEAVPALEKAASLDHMGNIHYQLYLAYRKLGEADRAQKALARSQEIRRSSLEHDQALVMGSPQPESDPQ